MKSALHGYNLKWLLVGLLIALLNPVFGGFIIGIAYYTEPDLRREGMIILGFTIIYVIVLRVFIDSLLSPF